MMPYSKPNSPNTRLRLWAALMVAAAMLSRSGPLSAENVDLSTVPAREGVQLTIYNSEDLTLVRETRKISFKPGTNPLQFSWANTLIDATSVQLKFVTHADKLEVLDTTFPHAKPQMLYWNVESEIDGEALVEITYFTSGISWTADYVLIADRDEAAVDFEGFVRVYNNSGEEYEDAEVRLVVGKINLVEKIAQLAQLPMNQVDQLSQESYSRFRSLAAEGAMGAVGPAADSAASEPKQIIKEGLSEYFLYTIEGTETINNGWSKRMRSLQPAQVPIKIEYRYREAEYGPQLVRMYLMRNDEQSKLGTTPLPDGMFRVFRDNGQDGLSFVTAQQVNYIPIGDKVELNLGVDPEVVFELVKSSVYRTDLWMNIHGAQIVRRIDDGRIEIDPRSSLAGWDEHTVYVQRIRNYTAKPIEVEVRRSYPGHVFFRSQLEPVLHDFQTVQYRVTVPASQEAALPYEVVERMGHNKKQDNVTLEAREILP